MADQTLAERVNMVMETIARHLDRQINHVIVSRTSLKAQLSDLEPWLVEVFQAIQGKK